MTELATDSRDEGTDKAWTVEYALNENDFVAFASVPFAHSWFFRFSPGVWDFFAFVASFVILVAIAFLADGLDWWYDPQFRLRAMGTLGLAFLLVIIGERPLKAWWIRRQVQSGRYAEFMVLRRLVLTRTGIFSSTRTDEDVLDWRAVKDIVVTPVAVYLMHTEESGYVVPRRAFPDVDSFAAFVRAAREFRGLVGQES